VPVSSSNHLIFRKYSFPRLTHFSQRNNFLLATASSTDGFLREIIVFLQLTGTVHLQQNEPSSTLKTTICWKYSFQKEQRNSMLDAEASKNLVFFGLVYVFNSAE
jgi:hypothetical protein